MTVQMVSKTALSVCEMARIVGMSRSRFYELIEAGIFPSPVYDLVTRRPFFTGELREACLHVRRTNCGVNGRTALFYAQRRPEPTPSRPNKKTTASKTSANHHADLLDGLRALGLANVTASQVDTALNLVFPSGTDGREAGEVIRAVFLRLKGQGSAA